MPFMFLEGTVVVPYQTYVVERCLANGALEGGVALRVPGCIDGLGRMSDLKGWGWSQQQLVGRKAMICLSPRRPVRTRADEIREIVATVEPVCFGPTVDHLREQGVPFWELKFTDDDRRLVGIGGSATCLWNIAQQRPLQIAQLSEVGTGSIYYTLCNREVAVSADCTATAGGRVARVFSTATGEELFKWVAKIDIDTICDVRAVRFSPDGMNLLMFGSFDKAVSNGFLSLDIMTRQGRDFAAPKGVVDGVFSSCGATPSLITRSRNGTISFWDWKAAQQLAAVELDVGEIEDIAASPDGKVVAVATEKQIHFLDVVTRKPVGGDTYEHPKVKRIRFANDNKHFASLSADGELRVWTLDFMEKIDPLKVAPQYDGQSF